MCYEFSILKLKVIVKHCKCQEIGKIPVTVHHEGFIVQCLANSAKPKAKQLSLEDLSIMKIFGHHFLLITKSTDLLIISALTVDKVHFSFQYYIIAGFEPKLK